MEIANGADPSEQFRNNETVLHHVSVEEEKEWYEVDQIDLWKVAKN